MWVENYNKSFLELGSIKAIELEERKDDFISLSEASLIAYEETHGYAVIPFAESQPGGPIGYYAIALTDRGRIPVYGLKPFMRKKTMVPSDEIRRGFISDDGKTLTRLFEEKPIYTALAITRSDMEKQIKVILFLKVKSINLDYG